MTVGITYDTDINTVKEILNTAILKVTDVEPDPKPITLVRELATSTVQIEVRFWVNSQRLTFIEMTSEAAQAIKEALQQAGIKLVTVPQLKIIQTPDHMTDDRDQAKAEKPS